MIRFIKQKAMLSVVTACLLAFYSCSSGNDTSGPVTPDSTPTDPTTPPTSTRYDEQYRPLIHYTPVKNWINDPNGMVYVSYARQRCVCRLN